MRDSESPIASPRDVRQRRPLADAEHITAVRQGILIAIVSPIRFQATKQIFVRVSRDDGKPKARTARAEAEGEDSSQVWTQTTYVRAPDARALARPQSRQRRPISELWLASGILRGFTRGPQPGKTGWTM